MASQTSQTELSILNINTVKDINTFLDMQSAHQVNQNELYLIGGDQETFIDERLPIITSADKGKFLKVNNSGEYQVQSFEVDLSSKLDKINPSGEGTFTFIGNASFSNGISAGSNKITSVADPTNNSDAATKGYVDDQISIVSGNLSVLTNTVNSQAITIQSHADSINNNSQDILANTNSISTLSSSKQDAPTSIVQTGISSFTLENNCEYRLKNISNITINLTSAQNENFLCHGFIKFNTDTTHLITISGTYLESGDDHSNIDPSSLWEFSATYFDSKYLIIWKQWG